MYSGPTKEHAGHIKRMHFQGWSNPYSISEAGMRKYKRWQIPNTGDRHLPMKNSPLERYFIIQKIGISK
jgi:hypothetical protein